MRGTTGGVETCTQHVDQDLDAILCTHRAGDGGNHGGQDHGMGDRSRHDVMAQKRQGPVGIPTQVSHAA